VLLCCSIFFFSSRRRHTRSKRDWSSDVCSSDLLGNLRKLAVADLAPENLRNLLLYSVSKLEDLEFYWYEWCDGGQVTNVIDLQRSEERRVGKECGSGWAAGVERTERHSVRNERY